MLGKFRFGISMFSSLLFACMMTGCKESKPAPAPIPQLSIILNDKTIDVILSNIQGKWKLKKITGGTCGCGSAVIPNSYMEITNNRIVFGDDSGITLDTTISWKRTAYHTGYSDSTFLLSYSLPNNIPYPIYEIVDQIQNGTLILIDDASDAYFYYYDR